MKSIGMVDFESFSLKTHHLFAMFCYFYRVSLHFIDLIRNKTATANKINIVGWLS